MATSSDIYVSFGADTGGLEAALALAKQNVTALTRELNSVAKEMRTTAAAADSELGVRMKSLGSDLAASKAQMGDIGDKLKTLSGGLEEAGAAATHGHTGIGFYVREVHALFDEFGSGRDRQAMGTLSNLIGTFLQANLSMIPLAAGVGVVAGSFAYLAYQAHVASQGIHSIELDAVNAQFRMTDDESQKLMTSIASLANVSNATATEIAKPFLALGPGGDIVAKLTATYLPLLADQMGEKTPKAAEALAEKFADLTGKGRAYIVETNGVTSAQIKAYDAFVAGGQVGQAYAMIVDAIRSRLASYSEGVKRSEAAERDAAAAALETSHAYLGMDAALVDLGGHLDETNAKLRDQAAAADEATRGLLTAVHAQQAFKTGLETAIKIDKVRSEIDATTAEIAKMQAAFRNLPGGDTDAAAQLARGLDIAQDHLKQLQERASDGLLARDAVAQVRDQIRDLDDTFKGSTVNRLQAERDLMSGLLASDKSTAEERKQLEQEIAAKDREIRDASNHVFLEQEDIKVTGAALTKEKVIAIREEEVAREIAIYGEGSDQALAAERLLATAKESLAKQGANASKTATKDALDAEQESLQGQIRAAEDASKLKIQLLNDEYKLKQITEQAKTAGTLSALAEEKSAIEAFYARELSLAGQTQAKVQAIRAAETHFLADNTEQVLKAQTDAAQKTEAAWDSAMKSVNGAFDSQINGLLSGTTTWHQAELNVLKDLTEKTLAFFVNWGLEQAENAAKGIVLNNAVVSSHVAGSTAMAAADQAVSSAGIGSMIANSLHAISVDAGQAAAGVTAFLAPILGPAALPAGEATGAAVVSLGGAFDSGSFSVPHDMVAGIHEGEMIIPQRGGVADEFRSFMASGGFSGDSRSGGKAVNINPSTHFHVSALDSGSVAQWMKSNSSTMMKSIDEAVRHGAHLGMRRL